MATEHYRIEYGESFVENLQKELGPEVSSQLTQPRLPPFTPTLKEAILRASQQRIVARSALRTQLDREGDSLRSSREEIEGLLESIEQIRVPEWYRDEFIDHVDTIAADRQELIRSNGHDFYGYLYNTEPISYPVLLALGRLREAIIV